MALCTWRCVNEFCLRLIVCQPFLICVHIHTYIQSERFKLHTCTYNENIYDITHMLICYVQLHSTCSRYVQTHAYLRYTLHECNKKTNKKLKTITLTLYSYFHKHWISFFCLFFFVLFFLISSFKCLSRHYKTTVSNTFLFRFRLRFRFFFLSLLWTLPLNSNYLLFEPCREFRNSKRKSVGKFLPDGYFPIWTDFLKIIQKFLRGNTYYHC